ncbi:MAG: hypothetical protein ABIL09_12550 [Gemmatimonadota bacterium]
MTTAVWPQADELARHLGAEADAVHRDEAMADRWAALDRGILVDVHIGRWRAETRMTLEDLGLTHLDNPGYLEALQQLTVLGRKYLLPKEVIQRAQRAEQRGRSLVEKHSFHVRLGRFVPFTAYADWKAEDEDARRVYFAVRDDICTHLGEYRALALDGYRRIAGESFDLLVQRGADPGQSRAAFVAGYLVRIETQIPPAERIHASWSWEVSLDYIPLPATVERDLLRREELRRQRQLNAEQEALVRSMNADLVRHVQEEKQQQIDGLLGHLRRQLLERIYEVTGEVGRKLRQQPSLSSSQVRSLRQLIDQVQRMNFLGDPSVDERIRQLEELVEQRPVSGNGADLPTVLHGLEHLNQSLREEASVLLSRRGIRAQMAPDLSGQELVFGRRVSRLRAELGDESIPDVPLSDRVRRQVRAA